MQLKYGLMTLALLVTSVAGAQNVVTDSLEFDKAMGSTPAEMLQGRISGVRVSATDGNINSAVNTYIRGTNALRSDSQPLWIVDGAIVNSSLNLNNEAFFQYGDRSYASPLNALAGLNLYDIESIEVLKDVSATAVYGTRGANGVIIVKTKKSTGKGFNIDWKSNVSLSTSSVDGTRNGLSHNHWINLSSTEEKYTYSVSANFKQMNGVIADNNKMYGGLHAAFDTRANSVVRFGMNANLAIGKGSTPGSVACYGQPSLTLAMRNPKFFTGDSVQGWQDDYDDDANEKRATASAHIDFNFTPSLVWKNTVGIDYQNLNRYLWYGNGTSFGKDYNGAASAMQSAIFKYNFLSVLSWDKTFARRHNIRLSAAFEAGGDWTKYNTTNGTDFFSHILRAKGLDIKGSAAVHHVFDHNYSTLGGFAKAGYSYAGFVGVDASVRADATPRYYRKPRMNWSAEGWFDFHKALMDGQAAVSTLKLTAGYGTAGRELYVPSGYYGDFVSGDFPAFKEDYTTFYEGLNSVSSKEFNAGVDFGAVSDRYTLHLGWYSKSTEDEFTSWYFGKDDPETGFSRLASFTNKGLEFDVNAVLIKTSAVDWSVFANGATNAFNVLEADENDTFGYHTKLSGTLFPKFSGALGTTLRAGGFTFDLLTDYASGFDILNLNTALFEGKEISDACLEKGDYFRFKRISLGYDFNMSKVKWIKGINLNLSALNLGTVSKYSGWNPDVNCYGTSLFGAGIDYGSCPAPRSIVLGVSFKF